MSDEQLRDLERRWKATGSVEDEALYLLERVRTGGLPNENVAVAAALGHAASAEVAAAAVDLPDHYRTRVEKSPGFYARVTSSPSAWRAPNGRFSRGTRSGRTTRDRGRR